MTLFQIICFSFATIALTINIIIIMVQILKQRNTLFSLLLKIAELEQKLESRLPLTPTGDPQEATTELTFEPYIEPIPIEPESPEKNGSFESKTIRNHLQSSLTSRKNGSSR